MLKSAPLIPSLVLDRYVCMYVCMYVCIYIFMVILLAYKFNHKYDTCVCLNMGNTSVCAVLLASMMINEFWGTPYFFRKARFSLPISTYHILVSSYKSNLCACSFGVIFVLLIEGKWTTYLTLTVVHPSTKLTTFEDVHISSMLDSLQKLFTVNAWAQPRLGANTALTTMFDK